MKTNYCSGSGSGSGSDFLKPGSKKGIDIFDPRITVYKVNQMPCFDFEYCYHVIPSRLDHDFISNWSKILEKNASKEKKSFINRLFSGVSK